MLVLKIPLQNDVKGGVWCAMRAIRIIWPSCL